MRTSVKKSTGPQRQWLAHIRRAEEQGIALAQYCQARGLSVQSPYNARYELAHKGRRAVAIGPAAKQPRARSRFVAVQVAADPAAATAATCRVHLKDVVIECASLPSPSWLAELARGTAHAIA